MSNRFMVDEQMPQVCIIAVYFGPLPPWFNLWLASCETNGQIDFLVVTDQHVFGTPINVRIIPETLDGVKRRLEDALGVSVYLGRPYKICDYKPFLGLAFTDVLEGYDYWGFCDIDLVFGDLGRYFQELCLNRYDKFLPLGHLFLIRNTEEVNLRVLLTMSGKEIWREVVATEENCAFDEIAINDIYIEYGFPICYEHPFADITTRQKRFTLGAKTVVRDGKFGYSIARYKNYRNQVFYWKGGKVGRRALVGGTVLDEEFMYIHFQKRRFTERQVNVSPGEDFYFGSEGFFAMEQLDVSQACGLANPYGGLADFIGGSSMLGPSHLASRKRFSGARNEAFPCRVNDNATLAGEAA